MMMNLLTRPKRKKDIRFQLYCVLNVDHPLRDTRGTGRLVTDR